MSEPIKLKLGHFTLYQAPTLQSHSTLVVSLTEARSLTEQLLKLGFGPPEENKAAVIAQVMDEAYRRGLVNGRNAEKLQPEVAVRVAKALRLMEVFERLCATDCACRPSTGCPESCEDCDWLNGVQQQLRAALDD